METINFTVPAIEAIPAPARGRVRYKDAKRPNLFLYVTPTARTFYMVARRDGRLHEERLGSFPSFKIEEARRKVDETLAAIERGEDPKTVGGRRRRGETFGELFTWWLDSHAKLNLRPRTWRSAETLYQRDLERHLAHRPVHAITREEMSTLGARVAADVRARARHGDGDRYRGVHSANDAVALVGRVIRHAIQVGRYKGGDPTFGLRLKGEEARDRVLSKEEIPPLLAALNRANPRIRDFALLCLWSGARSGPVLAMRWDQIDFNRREWRIPRSKDGKPELIYLEEPELAILRARKADLADKSPWVFPARHSPNGKQGPGHMVSPHKGWYAVVADAGLVDFRIHDLRRSHGSWMLHHGVPVKVVSLSLGHANQRVTEKVYAHLLNSDPVRAAKRVASQAIAAASEGKLWS